DNKSFRTKMQRMEAEVVKKDLEHYEGIQQPTIIPFSLVNSLPVLAITLTEGFEASIVLASAGAFNLQWTVIGSVSSIALLLVVSAISYDYLLRFPRWLLDLLARSVRLIFGTCFLVSGLLLTSIWTCSRSWSV